MHPIERLRWLAALDPSRVDLLAREAADALLGCAGQPAELVVAARRLLDRHPAAGPLWWVAATALTATDAAGALLDAAAALEDDPTAVLLDAELSARPGAFAIDAWSLGRDGAFATPAAVLAAEHACADGHEVLVRGGVGTALPLPVWEIVVDRVRAAGPRSPALLSWDAVEMVMGPRGLVRPAAAVAQAACPLAPELLRPPVRGGESRPIGRYSPPRTGG